MYHFCTMHAAAWAVECILEGICSTSVPQAKMSNKSYSFSIHCYTESVSENQRIGIAIQTTDVLPLFRPVQD